MKMWMIALLIVPVVFLSTNILQAWDPWGDIQNPGRIIENTKRETGQAVKTVGDAVSKAAPVIATIACPGCSILVNALPQDQKTIVETIVKSGMVITTLGPVVGTYYLTVLNAPNGDVHRDDVPMLTVNAPPTANKYTVDFQSTACMAQLDDGNVQIYSKKKPPFWDIPIQPGDLVIAKSGACPEYNALKGIKNITSITLKISGASTNQLAPDDGTTYRYLMLGFPYSG